MDCAAHSANKDRMGPEIEMGGRWGITDTFVNYTEEWEGAKVKYGNYEKI